MTSGAGTQTLRTGGPAVAWRETGEEIVVLDLSGSVYFGLNPTAARLWKQLVGGTTRDELSRRLCAEQGIGQEQADADVDAFLDMLGREGLLSAD